MEESFGWVCGRPPPTESRLLRVRRAVRGGLRDEVVARVEHAARPRLVLVEAARVALQAAVDAVLGQGLSDGGVPGVEEVVVERVAAPLEKWTFDMSPLTGHAILNSIIGTATGWSSGQTPTTGYAMWLLWSGESRWRPSQQLGAW